MKKQNLLKLAFTMLAMVFMTGVMAQVTEINHDDDAATGTNYVEATAETYQTENLSFRLYVLPDGVYNPSYDGTGNAGTGLALNSRWTWVFGVDYASGTPLKSAANENWVDLDAATDFPAVEASRTFWVLETNTLFSCEGTATSHVLNVVGEPTADIAGRGNDGTNTWDEIIAGTEYRRCATGADIGDVVDVTLTELGAPVAANNYTFGITVMQQPLDENLLDDGPANDVTGTYGVAATPASLDAGLAQTHTIPALPLIDVSTPTKYIVSLTGSSIYSTITKTSQLRAGVAEAGFSGAATTVTYTILPVPTTGPIFHIPNAF